MNSRELECETCATIRVFEQPPCPDGHGPECAEWFCTMCGAALILGHAPVVVELCPVIPLRRAA